MWGVIKISMFMFSGLRSRPPQAKFWMNYKYPASFLVERLDERFAESKKDYAALHARHTEVWSFIYTAQFLRTLTWLKCAKILKYFQKFFTLYDKNFWAKLKTVILSNKNSKMFVRIARCTSPVLYAFYIDGLKCI